MTKPEAILELLKAGCPGELAVYLAFSVTDYGVGLLVGRHNFDTWQIIEPAAPGRDAVMRPESVDETARRLVVWVKDKADQVAEAVKNRENTPTPGPFPRP